MSPGQLMVISVVNLKGGTGKTTTAAYVAHSLFEQGRRVLAVDADPQASLYTWHQAAAFPFSCVAMVTGRLHREVPGVADGYDVVVIDTPPTEHGKAIALSAVRAADLVLVPVAPTPVEYERLRALRALLEDARDLDASFAAGVLVSRTVAGAASTSIYRELMEADGWYVLRATVPRLERYAQAMGSHVERAQASGYGDAVAELIGVTA